MTKRHHLDVLNFIVTYTRDHGIPPSYREMAAAMGWNLGQMHTLVQMLVDRGFITQTKFKSRSIRIVRIPADPEPPNPEDVAELADELRNLCTTVDADGRHIANHITWPDVARVALTFYARKDHPIG
jgi:SOS-response transcriptional repressor LexA